MMYRIIIIIIHIFTFGYALNLTLHDYDDPSVDHISDSEIINDILIVTGLFGGIDFYDISNPTHLNHLRNFTLNNNGGGGNSKPNCVRAIGDYAYITAKNGVAVIDISNPSNPQYIRYLNNSNGYNLENLDIYANLLAVTAHEDGILLYDISNPENPNYYGRFDTENAWTVALTHNTAYVGDQSNLLVVDVSNPMNPQLISSLAMSNAIKDIQYQWVDDSDDLLYVALGTDGVGLFNAENLSELSVYNTSGLANRLDITDNKVAVSDWDDVEILEWNNTHLNLVGYKNTTRRTMAIAMKNNFIYSAEWKSIQVFEYGEIEGPDVDLSTYELNYPYVENGQSYTMSLDVINNGHQILTTSDYVTHSDFQILTPIQDIEPGSYQTIDIQYVPNSNNASGSYGILSNDNDEFEVKCQTNGNINGANIGQEAPDFELDIIANGNGTFKLSDYQDQIVVIAFFAPGWPVCSPELSDMETSIWQEYQNEGLIVIGISNTMNIGNFVDENSLTFPILFDPGSNGGVDGGHTYDLYYLPNDGSPYPRDFIVNTEGILEYANNEIDMEWMIYIIENLLGLSNLIGDINGDENLNILDIVLITNLILSDSSYNETADLNQDGGINILDIIVLISIILGR